MNLTNLNLRTYRESLGLSQAKLAEITGISQSKISAYELCKVDISKENLAKIINITLNNDVVSSAVNRPKRYKKHTYTTIKKDLSRVERAKKSIKNTMYKELLNQIYILHKKEKTGSLSALSLFSGCGGFSLGFSAAGFNIKGFVEKDQNLKKIYKTNFPQSVDIGTNIKDITEDELSFFSSSLGKVDVIIGGPPCQGFSLAGKRDVEDDRNTLFKHYLRFVDVFKPKVAVMENVKLLTSMRNKEGGFIKDDIYQEFKSHGYKVAYYEINAKNYGVPQSRDRVIFIAIRDDLNLLPSLVKATHSENIDLFSNLEEVLTFSDACSDLPFIESGESSDISFHNAVKHPVHVIDWLWDVQEGRSAHENEDIEKRPLSGYNTTYKRQFWNKPAATVQTTFGMISGSNNVHPIATRSLTIREAARLQSFPDDYKFEGTLGTIRTGIGNAVPPLLAYKIAKHLLEEGVISCKNN